MTFGAPGRHRARKRFGQHFLHDETIVARIIEAIAPRTHDFMVEIGPGLGALTLPLLRHLATLHAIEIDRDAIAHLRARAAWHTGFHLHEADILEFDLSQLHPPGHGATQAGTAALAAAIPLAEKTNGLAAAPAAGTLRVVGNLPYNISTPLLFRLIEQRRHIEDMHFMLQKEVVDRMTAHAGTPHYGRLSVMLAPWLRIEPLFDVEPAAFRPPPRVRSTFVRLQPAATPLDISCPRHFSVVVAAAFSQRRKTLRNALRALLSAAEIAAAGVDPAARAEVITAAGFAMLAAQLAQKTAPPPLPDS